MMRHSMAASVFLAGALAIALGAAASAAPQKSLTDDRGVFIAIAKAP